MVKAHVNVSDDQNSMLESEEIPEFGNILEKFRVILSELSGEKLDSFLGTRERLRYLEGEAFRGRKAT